MFEKQCWWITGASAGIGEAIVRAPAARAGYARKLAAGPGKT